MPGVASFPAPALSGYPRETVIAEKFQAMVYLRTLNSRMKYFYDVWLLARQFAFDGSVLAKAITATFTHRETAIDVDPIAFTPESSPSRRRPSRSGPRSEGSSRTPSARRRSPRSCLVLLPYAKRERAAFAALAPRSEASLTAYAKRSGRHLRRPGSLAMRSELAPICSRRTPFSDSSSLSRGEPHAVRSRQQLTALSWCS
jgi:hypothetical protein